MTQATTSAEVQTIAKAAAGHSKTIQALVAQVERVVVGQRDMVEGLVIGLLCNGHVLLEGVPGLAKTLTVSTLAQAIHASFARIQFTPDLLPADLVARGAKGATTVGASSTSPAGNRRASSQRGSMSKSATNSSTSSRAWRMRKVDRWAPAHTSHRTYTNRSTACRRTCSSFSAI